MSEPLITECPGCHARFRVTEGQLKLAGGQVRCGACLQVFDARNEAERLRLRRRREQLKRALEEAFPAVPSRSDSSAGARPLPSSPSSSTGSPKTALATAAETEVTAEQIPHLHAEPILLETPLESSDPMAIAGWTLAVLAALALLLGQYAWFERGTLARNPNLAPFYTLACDRLVCDLDYNQVQQIHTEQLIVRPHPSFADALSVDLRLLNQAAFAQPWPALQLSFSDLQGRLVAQRTFQPEDYLTNGELNQTRMPAGTPVELRLQITDPGGQALSYSLEVKPAPIR